MGVFLAIVDCVSQLTVDRIDNNQYDLQRVFLARVDCVDQLTVDRND